MQDDNKHGVLRKLALRGIAGFIVANVLLLYVPISAVGLGSIVLAALGCLFFDRRNLFAFAVSLILITLVLEGVVRWVVPSTLTPYYRPHEMLALEKTYRPKERVQMDVPHGDLPATDPMIASGLAEPREEVFVTDVLGYRNDSDYSDERLLIVGDSYVVGVGNTQKDTLTAQLHRDYGVRAYNLGFPSDPQGYAERVSWARGYFTGNSCMAVVFFEGNDFQLVNPAELASRNTVPKGFQQALKYYVQAIRGRSEFSKLFYGLTTRSWEILSHRVNKETVTNDKSNLPQNLTFVKRILGKPMGFLRGYAEVVHRRSFDDHGFIKAKLAEAKPDLVIFVPDKYRIYSGFFDDGAIKDLPNAQWSYLLAATKELGIPAFDITQALIEYSQKVLSNNETTYWRDDTHWNRQGIRVGAGQVVTALRSLKNDSCRKVLVD